MRWPCCWPAPGTWPARAARSTSWDRPDTRMFGGATVVIVGAGAIGRELIRMLEPFRCRVVAVNRTGTPVEGAAETLPVSRLDEACAMGEYVVLAAPATPDTHSLIGERQLTAMPREAWIVNVGRGPLIDTAALTTALAQGVVREPPSTSPSPSPARRPPALARATLPDHLPLGEPGGRAPVVAGRPGGREPGGASRGASPCSGTSTPTRGSRTGCSMTTSEKGASMTENATGVGRNITSYGDTGFSRYLRAAFLAGAGYDADDLTRPFVGIADLSSDYNPATG